MRIVVGFSGASGIIYGWRLVKVLAGLGHDVWVVVSRNAVEVGLFECSNRFVEELKEVSTGFCFGDDWSCDLASGSFIYDAMVVIPCSLKSLAAIANGIGDNLLTRTALNAIRLGRKLVLVVRETPWSSIDFENAARLSRMGVIVMPASPAFYHNPKSISDLVDYVVGRVLDVLGIDHDLYARWSRAKTQGPLNLCVQDV